MDSVEGRKGGKVLLTLHFVNCSFMLAFIREYNDAQSVIDIFNYLQDILGINKFKELFILILTDTCEVNHELLRRILPKGTSFNNLTQEDINLIMSHINSYKRKKLNNVSPLTLFSTIYGKDTLDKLNIREINSNDINLTSNILK